MRTERRAEMERLTYEIIDGGMVTDKENIKEFEIEDGFAVYAGNAVFRLADYEDTGLTPEQIRELAERDTARAPEPAPLGEGGMVCPSCGKKALPWDRFCGECGQRFWEDE